MAWGRPPKRDGISSKRKSHKKGATGRKKGGPTPGAGHPIPTVEAFNAYDVLGDLRKPEGAPEAHKALLYEARKTMLSIMRKPGKGAATRAHMAKTLVEEVCGKVPDLVKMDAKNTIVEIVKTPREESAVPELRPKKEPAYLVAAREKFLAKKGITSDQAGSDPTVGRDGAGAGGVVVVAGRAGDAGFPGGEPPGDGGRVPEGALPEDG